MSKVKVIAIAVVAVLLVSSAVVVLGHSLFDGRQIGNHSGNNDNNDNQNTDFSFGNLYFDLSGATSLLLMKETSVGASAASASSKVSNEARLVIGDDTSDQTTALYKKNNLGETIKVKLFENEQSMKENTNEVRNDYEALSMTCTDDGKYLFMLYGKVNSHDNSGEYRYLKYIVVSLETGKIYQLNGEGWSGYYQAETDYRYSVYSQYNMNRSEQVMHDGSYTYLGSSGKYMFIRNNATTGILTYYAAYEENGELIMKELTSSKLLNFHNATPTVFKGGMMRLTEVGGNSSKSYLIFATGELMVIDNSYKECDGNICKSVTYYDGNNYFPSSAKVITGYNADTHQPTTEDVSYTKSEAYGIATRASYERELCKDIGNETTTIVMMDTIQSVKKVHLNIDCTSTEDASDPLPFRLEPLAADCTINDDTGGGESTFSYVVVNKHICQSSQYTTGISPSNVMVDSHYLYQLGDGGLVSCDLLDTSSTHPISIAGLINISTVDFDDEKLVVSGLSDRGSTIRGVYNYQTGALDTSYSNVMKEIVIRALN